MDPLTLATTLAALIIAAALLVFAMPARSPQRAAAELELTIVMPSGKRLSLRASAACTIAQIKRLVFAAAPDVPIPARQRLAKRGADALGDETTLLDAGIVAAGNELVLVEGAAAPGALLRHIGGTGKGPLEFNQPNGICVDAARRHIVIADRENNRVQCVDATTLRPVWTHASTGGTLNYPNFCAMSVDNTLVFVTDGWSNRVATLDATSGKFIASCGSRGEGALQFDAPQGVAVSPVDGHVWVADHSNHRVSIYDASVHPWHSLGQIGSTGVDGDSNEMLSSPHGIAIAGGRVYVCDQGNHRVQVFDAATRAHVRTITGAPASPLQSPTGICVLGDALYVCDRDNARVCVFNATSGAFRGVCGSSDSRNDSGAPLFSPFVFHTGVYAVCADAARQEILVTDAGMNRVSVFAAYA